MKPLFGVAAACALFGAQVRAEPFTVDHLLRQEQLGAISVDPSQRWLVVQTQARWDSAPLYDLDDGIRLALGRVQVFDLARNGAARPLPLAEPGVGYTAGPLSPSGRHLAVLRLVGHAWELGVADLETGQVFWLDLSPQHAVWGRTLAWRNDDQLVVATRNPAAPDARLGLGWLAQERLPRQWAAAARGEAAMTVMGSGRYRDLRPKAPPGELVMVDLARSQRRVLAIGDVVDLEIAPHGDQVAAIMEGEDLQPIDDTPATSGTVGRRRRLLLTDLASGETWEPCPSCDVLSRLLSWSDRGDGLLVYARTDAGPWRDGGFWRVPTRGVAARLDLQGFRPVLEKAADNADLPRAVWLDGAPVVLTDGPGGRAWRRITPTGAHTLVAGLAEPGRIAAADPKVLLLASASAVWRVTAKGARRLSSPAADLTTTAAPPPGERFGYAPPPLAGVATVTAKGAEWVVTDIAGGRHANLAAGETLAATAPSRNLDVFVRRDPHGVQTVSLVPFKGPARVLATINSHLAGVDFVTPTPVRHKGVDGEPLTSWLFLPNGARPGREPPLVIIPYPGDVMSSPPASQLPPASRLLTNAQVLVARGYAVLIPSLPYRKDREPMEGLADQMLVAVDAAATQRPVDPARLAVWGHSYGGYAALAAASQTSRFKAVIAGAATTNLISAYGRLGPMANAVPEVGNWTVASAGWLETGQARMNLPPWRDPARYVRNSPVLFADKITASVLMFYGDADKDISQSQSMFAALYRQTKNAILVTYRGEGHVVLGPGNVRDQYRRLFDFLRETIGPGLEHGDRGPGAGS
ncbi:S9 family peptidase [Caulobacter sp. 602-1]|uniref:alpha/beta hydrolase family protein n=1 Tax=Caulobacter sp. 602-1 TaxID=2492472 RepID=UPI000F631789|nr:prolyl oligopeptidase family serine peptidase [Caulobacter sp. 602-1]RRN63454.1 S9 family peptidase [Caulobacter sp. 602-1]